LIKRNKSKCRCQSARIPQRTIYRQSLVLLLPKRSRKNVGYRSSPPSLVLIFVIVMEHLKQTGTPVDSQKQHCCNAIIHRRDHDQHRLPPQLLEKSPSPVQHTKPAYPPAPAVESYPSEPLKPQPPSPVEKPSNVRFSDQLQTQPRPAGGPRSFSSLELSTIDQKWGRLFDSNGDPTQRLGQFLRGLANHIVCS
jgi:hypothetical protein